MQQPNLTPILGFALIVFLIILVILWPYREVVGFLSAGLLCLAVLVGLGIRIMQAVDNNQSKNEQRLRRSRLRPFHDEQYEIPLDATISTVPRIIGDQTYYTSGNRMNDDFSSRSQGNLTGPFKTFPSDTTYRDNDTKRPTLEEGKGSRGNRKPLTLFAIAQAILEEDNKAFVSKVYSVQTGISQSKPEDFEGGPFDLSIFPIVEPLLFDILLHTSNNIELTAEWQKHVLYEPHSSIPQLVEFTFQIIAPGQSTLDINFYHERRWLRTIHFELNAVEQSQLTRVSNEE